MENVVSKMLTGAAMEAAKQTGIDIVQDGSVIFWQGRYGGQVKPRGPLAGKKIACVVASEFSDFQAYYLASYIGEFGGDLEFLCVDWVTYKFTRPNIKSKGVIGMWGLSLDPIPVMGPTKHGCKKLVDADPQDYQAVVVLGGHSGDIMVTESKVMGFLKAARANGAIIGGIGAGIMPMIRCGVVEGKACTGSAVVAYMLKKVADFQDGPVVVDGKVITARDTVDTPAFVRALCKAFDPEFEDKLKGILAGKRMLVIAGEDFEDIELAVPVMEYLYRGAQVTLATFPAPVRARPPLVGLDVVQGNFGMSVPLQEIPESYYDIKKLSEVSLDEFDALQIPGAFCPYNMVEAGTPLEFLKQADAAGKILTYICHGAIPVAAADLVQGKKVAGWQASQDSVNIMGGEYNGAWAAVIDGKHVSGRTPPEIPEFLDAITVALLGN
ncbi:MAG: DJ-1/PfpI family protein [Desulfobacterales bacterium]|nr:MAG: DJ-1/PfpI family protein [Desulfobacterales bacterium]